MRFMMFMYPDPDMYASGAMPTAADTQQMMQYNEALVQAGVLMDGSGLHPASNSVRVSFPAGKPQVKDGPFSEAKEVIGGYWLIQTKTRAEAIEWAKRVPSPSNSTNFVELRQLYEMSDFPQDVQAVAENSPAWQAAQAKSKA